MKRKSLQNNNVKGNHLFLKIVLGIILFTAINSTMAQIGTAKEFTWDGISREYIEYVPSTYNSNQPTAVLFMLHGLRDSMEWKLEMSGMLPFADQYGWIIIVPQALNASISLMGQTIEIGSMWNAGMNISVMGMTLSPNSDVDDCGFLIGLLESVKESYNIHNDSVFFSGISMGGFMCQRIAIEHSNVVNAIASVSGTIANGISTSLPETAVDIMHIHGTNDNVVTYDGADFSFEPFGTFNIGLSAEATVEYWRNVNQCNSEPRSYVYHNTKDDGFTFERYDYNSSTNNNRVAFIKVINGEHDWYGDTELYDIGYANEIQKFFRGEQPTNVGIENVSNIKCKIYPNPASDIVNITSKQNINKVELYNTAGALVSSTQATNNICKINVNTLKPGIYLARIYTEKGISTNKIVIK